MEYQCLATTASELILATFSLFCDLRISLLQKPILWCDNLRVVHPSVNLILHSKTKHVEIGIDFVCDLVLQKRLLVQHLPATNQIAVVLTKPFVCSFVSSTYFQAQCLRSSDHWFARGVKAAH